MLDSVDPDDDNGGINVVDETANGTDPLDPDSSDDGIGDNYDDDPLTGNACFGATSRDFTATVDGPVTCAATSSITVNALAEVLANGDLHLIAPAISVVSGFSVAGLLTQRPPTHVRAVRLHNVLTKAVANFRCWPF